MHLPEYLDDILQKRILWTFYKFIIRACLYGKKSPQGEPGIIPLLPYIQAKKGEKPA